MKVRCRGLEQVFHTTWDFILLRKRSHISQADPCVHCVAQDNLEFMLQPLPPQCWDYWHAPSHRLCHLETGTQGSLHARQELCQMIHIPSLQLEVGELHYWGADTGKTSVVSRQPPQLEPRLTNVLCSAVSSFLEVTQFFEPRSFCSWQRFPGNLLLR